MRGGSMRAPRPAFLTAALAAAAVCAAPPLLAAPEPTGRDTAVAWFDGLVGLVGAEALSPVVAARVYGYSSVAFFETLVPWSRDLRSLSGQLTDLGPVPGPNRNLDYDAPAAAVVAAGGVARGLLGPGAQEALAALEQQLVTERYYRPGTSAAAIDRSLEHGRSIAREILDWASTDGYGLLARCPYTPPAGAGLWRTTPPAFAPALEPCWGALRPMVLESGSTCQVEPPPTYSETPGSAFYVEGREVYDVSRTLTEEQRTIALFWADNPGQTGTPAGHWMRIVGFVAAQEGLDVYTTAEAYARTGIAVNDAFINCWYTKYSYNLLRPIDYIRKLFDPGWVTAQGLPTPPFPEYTSGHSTQSGASATILSDLFGIVGFTDSTHVDRGLAPRRFPSLEAGAREAAISRLYGGIHYRAAIEIGLDQGRCVAANVLARVRFRQP
jgi:hypothetical protein